MAKSEAKSEKTRSFHLHRFTAVKSSDGDKNYFSNTYVLPESEARAIAEAAGKDENGKSLVEWLDKEDAPLPGISTPTGNAAAGST